MTTPILVLGAGRMGGALVEGWGRVGSFRPADLILRDPNPGPDALASVAAGAILNPPDERLAEARTVLMAVKPQVWRIAAGAVVGLLAPDAVIVSIAAGVRAADIAEAFGGRAVARVMPTTAVAIAKGTASVFSTDPAAAARAHALFDPVATVVDLASEDLMDAATAVSGSGPGYVYAFVEALEAAGVHAGLPEAAAKRLARATVAGAAALMEQSGTDPADLRRQVTSPAGTTEAALKVLMAQADGLGPLLQRAVDAAVARARELAGWRPAMTDRAVTVSAADVLDRAAEAALTLARDKPWGEIALRDIARAAGVGFAELYGRAPGKAALLDRLSRRFDAEALAAAEDDTAPDAQIHDRLFEAVMARLEAMAPHRDALIAIARAEGLLVLGPRMPATARALLEAAGIDTGGPRGALRVAAMTAVWLRTLQVWRDDEGALNRTMAEIDKRLRHMQGRLRRIGAGF